MRTPITLLATLAFALLPLVAQGQSDKAAEKLARKSDCFKCHAISKKKDGPSYREIAAKYKGEADAEAKLYEHITTSPMVEVDGKEEEHTRIKSDDPEEIRNLVRWIMTR